MPDVKWVMALLGSIAITAILAGATVSYYGDEQDSRFADGMSNIALAVATGIAGAMALNNNGPRPRP